jgi:hypothetical protein
MDAAKGGLVTADAKWNRAFTVEFQTYGVSLGFRCALAIG